MLDTYSADEVYGPLTRIGEETSSQKHRGANENFYDAMARVAAALADSEIHRKQTKNILLHQRFLPGGRIQAAIGSPRRVTPYNCFLSGTINDSFRSIMDMATEAGLTMRMGGGIGYDYSGLRPKGDLIRSLESSASGPVSFMKINNAVCNTISSSGHRRGAQMAVLRVDHPDIEEFIRCKQNDKDLTQFNISVGITEDFMDAMTKGLNFELTFGGRGYNTVDAPALWDEIMRSTWDWAEPGVLFLDRINAWNNLYYCETIKATNPCGEQPLPPYGACLLGSFNLTKYVADGKFNWPRFEEDIPIVIRAMDNVIDKAVYPLKEHEREAKNKRRMGIGVTGLANAGEYLGYPYGEDRFLDFEREVLKTLRDISYATSVELARDKEPFPLFDRDAYMEGKFIKTLPKSVQEAIGKYGIRNSHLLSIAPTGSISLAADNISSSIEPVFAYQYDRTVQTNEGPVIESVKDYGVEFLGVHGKTTDDITIDEHLNVLLTAQRYVDSAVSKTCNVGDDVSWHDFKDVYYKAWKGGAKGVTTFRKSGKRFGILNVPKEEKEEKIDVSTPIACSIDGTCE